MLCVWPIRPRHHGGSTPAVISADRAATDRGVLASFAVTCVRRPLALDRRFRPVAALGGSRPRWVDRVRSSHCHHSPFCTRQRPSTPATRSRSSTSSATPATSRRCAPCSPSTRCASSPRSTRRPAASTSTSPVTRTYPPSIRRTRTSDCPATPASTSSRSGATSSHPAHLVHCPAHRCARAPQRVVGRAGCPGVGALNKIVAVVPGPDHGMEPTRGGPGG